MPTISQKNDLITVILIFSVEPEQQALVKDFEVLLEVKYAVLCKYWQGLAENEFHL